MQNDAHHKDCVYLEHALWAALNGEPGTVVFHDLRIDWQKDGIRPMGPDLLVLRGVFKPFDPRDGTFEVADAGATPALVIEVTSPSTRATDLNAKIDLYRRAEVPLYAIVDTLPDTPTRGIRLLGFRLRGEAYEPVELSTDGRLWLWPVKLWLGVEGGKAACYDEAGQRVPSPLETVRALRKADARHEQMVGEMEDEITARQEAERQAREAEARAADAETKLRDALAEVRRLRG